MGGPTRDVQAHPGMTAHKTHLITQLLGEAAGGGTGGADASNRLMSLVYDELRRMAAAEMARESPGRTLQPTALVNEAYMRLLGEGGEQVSWDNRGHFFGAAALAMRRILVDRARARNAQKRGGERRRVDLDDASMASGPDDDTAIAVDEVLKKLDAYDRTKGQLVMLRYFAGLSLEQTAQAMGLTLHAVRKEWAFARAWMHTELVKLQSGSEPAT